jgi:hypothetical protein
VGFGCGVREVVQLLMLSYFFAKAQVVESLWQVNKFGRGLKKKFTQMKLFTYRNGFVKRGGLFGCPKRGSRDSPRMLILGWGSSFLLPHIFMKTG